MSIQDILMDYLSCRNWAVDEQRLTQAMELLRQFASTQTLPFAKLFESQDKKAADSDKTAAKNTKYGVAGDAAVIEVSGLIVKYARMVNGPGRPKGTSCEELSQLLAAALADPSVKRIIFQIESPGGSMSGLPDFADQVYRASFQKPIVAFADDLAASAAYWIGSQANAFYANQSAMIGSIGVYTVMADMTGLMEKIGLKYHLIRSGENKGAGYPGTEITDANLAAIQEMIDEDFEMFISTILRGRGDKLSEETLRKSADGRCFNAKKAIKLNLIDGIMPFEQVFSKRPRIREANASIAAASAENFERKEEIMTKEIEQKSADAAAEKQSAAEQERSRILAIQSALSDKSYSEIAAKAIAEGWDIGQAKSAAFDVAQQLRAAEAKAAGEKMAEMQARLDAIARCGHHETLKAAGNADVDKPLKNQQTAAGQAAGDADAYMAKVEELKKQGKTDAQAYALAAQSNPADHRAWISQQKK